MRTPQTESENEIIRIKPPVAGELRKNGTTANIQLVEGVTVEMLLAFGFRMVNKDRYIYSRGLGCDIDFCVTLKASDLNDLQIDVIDENFGQPYDYQLYIMSADVPGRVASIIYEKVEVELTKLQDAGILRGHVRGNYV